MSHHEIGRKLGFICTTTRTVSHVIDAHSQFLQDVIEMLEKRVNSRFSHTLITVNPLSSAEKVIHLFRELMMIDGDMVIDSKQTWNQSIENLFDQKKFQELIEENYMMQTNLQWYQRIFVSVPFINTEF